MILQCHAAHKKLAGQAECRAGEPLFAVFTRSARELDYSSGYKGCLHNGLHALFDFGELHFIAIREHGRGDELAHHVEIFGIEAARGSSRRAHANAARHKRAAGLVGNGVLVHGKADAFKQLLASLPVTSAGVGSTKAQVVVGAARHQTQAAIDKAIGHRGTVLHHVIDVRF